MKNNRNKGDPLTSNRQKERERGRDSSTASVTEREGEWAGRGAATIARPRH